MTDAIIRVENLGKRYTLRHKAGEARYTALRDVIADKVRSLSQRMSPADAEGKSIATREDFWALKGVSFSIAKGDVVGIIGRNGAGKSTLLKLLSRITEPTTGRICLNGRVASLLEVGTGFHPELTGRENIYLNGAILGMSRAETRSKFDAIVAFAGVEQFLDTPVKRYSSGMYVRLAFAVAAHLETEILIIDEVLAVGDAEFQKKCLGKMQDVAGQGRTVLFVSHNMPTVLNLCRRAIMMANGKIYREGGCEEVISEYLSQGIGDSAQTDLAAHTGRMAGSERIMQSLRMFDSTGVASTTFRMGESFSLEVDYKSDRPMSSLRCGVGIYSQLGMRIASLATFYDSDFEAPGWSQAGTLRCDASNLNLSAGIYFIGITLGDSQTDLDRIEQAAQFEVTAWDVFRTGVVPLPNQGVVWTSCQHWEHSS